MTGSKIEADALAAMRGGRLQDALVIARRGVVGATSLLPVHALLATILLKLDLRRDAEAVVEGAFRLEPGTGDACDALAYVSLMLGSHEQANKLYHRAVAQSPQNARFWYNLASSERSFGRLKEAETACNRSIALDPEHYSSYLLRSELLVQTPQSNHLEELERQVARLDLDDRGRVVLGYALAKELDDLQQFSAAFRWFKVASAARRRLLSYDIAGDEHKLCRVIEAFPADLVAATAPAGSSGRYAFIIGLPRSGTTLVERILSGHKGVISNGETDNFMRALLACAPANGSDIFARAAAADPACVARQFSKLADSGSPLGRSTSDLVVEKLPMNYLYLGAIHRALPAASLIWVKRSPLDSCFALYRTLFGEACPFSYDFEELARYYSAYEKLMQHWQHALGARLHEVRYEDLVADPKQIGSAMVRYCGLSWEETAVEVERNASVSLTASAAQIRRPIYGTSSNRWRHYAAELKPLIDALRRRGIDVPNDV